ncbi:MAG: MGH1-like glycoside hydrolase domain-containing protein [Planctomycetaceae bacterium]
MRESTISTIVMDTPSETAEELRLAAAHSRKEDWQRWGPYLSERQWGTVREDYSPHGDSWGFFPHDHARSRAYRWGEDGLMGISDRQGRLCFALALWNGRDPILKERLFGLTGPEGNHGEDPKELYYYLDSTPTHSYMKALYKYPQAEYPYGRLIDENRGRSKTELEFELVDTGIFNEDRYFDVVAEYAKASPQDILIKVTIHNRGPEAAILHVLPTLWLRNTWSWSGHDEMTESLPGMKYQPDGTVSAWHEVLGEYSLAADNSVCKSDWLFTDNVTNAERVYGGPNNGQYVKDAFHERVIHGKLDAVSPHGTGTKTAAWYQLKVEPHSSQVIRMRFTHTREKTWTPRTAFAADFDKIFATRLREADEFYAKKLYREYSPEAARVARQGYAGLLWTKQFYHYVVPQWLKGDEGQPPPPASRKYGRNRDWPHLFNRDVISMPDKWEYPWYAAWDLAFHMVPFARLDGEFAKHQLLLFLREWYMHPNGQLPAYEFGFGDVNPPVHAWACWRVYKLTGKPGKRDRIFLARAFQKLLLNFTWWINRKDIEGNNMFGGGFLGLDNIGVFDRSQPLPTGGSLQQADGTAWMAFFCSTMLAIALELASEDPSYEDIASKFFEHFVAIADAMNTLGGSGLWDEADGFYYDQLKIGEHGHPMRIRSVVGIIPLFAAEILDPKTLDKLPGFKHRMKWFLNNRKDLAKQITICERDPSAVDAKHSRLLLAIPSRERLRRVLQRVLDESEFLSPYGLRALSRTHAENPFVFRSGDQELRVDYVPGESNTSMFGGNSNWRGPIWFPVNYLLIEALERYHHFYGDEFKVECPVGSGKMLTLKEVATELSRRLSNLFLPDANGRRPCHGDDPRYADDPHWKDLVLFYEYFHGDTGRGCGASHQTGWTALVTRLLK